jgi:hypothetical protein
MSEHCGNCNCGHHENLDKDKIENIKEELKNKRDRKYTIKYRISLSEMECDSEEFIERIKSFAGIVDEVEFTEKELIISYDDRLITPSEIEKLVQ